MTVHPEELKCFSKTPVSIMRGDLLHLSRRQHYIGSPAIPLEFVPSKIPEFCKCTVVDTDGITSKGRYKAAPDLYQKPTTLWLPYGPPETNKRCYMWKKKIIKFR